MAKWETAGSVLPQLFKTVTAGPPPLPVGKRGATPRSHEIDFEIHGDDLQLVEIELDPEEIAALEKPYLAQGIVGHF